MKCAFPQPTDPKAFFATNNKLLRARDAALFLGIYRSTFWAWVHDGKIRSGIRLSPRCIVWELKTLIDFVESRKN